MPKIDGLHSEEQDTFIRLFLSEHLIGETQNQIKKLIPLERKEYTLSKTNFLPADLLYVFHKKEKYKQKHGREALNSTMGSVGSNNLNDTMKSRKKTTDRLGKTGSVMSMGHVVFSKDESREQPLFMTIAYRNDHKQVMIEVPLDRERNFMVLSAFIMLRGKYKNSTEEREQMRHADLEGPGGSAAYVRTLFDSHNGKKFKYLMTQKYLIKSIHANPAVKP